MLMLQGYMILWMCPKNVVAGIFWGVAPNSRYVSYKS